MPTLKDKKEALARFEVFPDDELQDWDGSPFRVTLIPPPHGAAFKEMAAAHRAPAELRDAVIDLGLRQTHPLTNAQWLELREWLHRNGVEYQSL
jgi:hypothetical protein